MENAGLGRGGKEGLRIGTGGIHRFGFCGGSDSGVFATEKTRRDPDLSPRMAIVPWPPRLPLLRYLT